MVLNCQGVSGEGRGFFIECDPNLLAFLRNDQKLNLKTRVFQLKVKSNIKTRNEEILFRIRRGSHPSAPCSLAYSLTVCSNFSRTDSENQEPSH